MCLQGAASVSAYVTHGVFPNATYERFSPQGNGASADGFKYFWITDSCANTANALRDRAPFEVGPTLLQRQIHILSKQCMAFESSSSCTRTWANARIKLTIHFVGAQVLSLAEPIAAALQI